MKSLGGCCLQGTPWGKDPWDRTRVLPPAAKGLILWKPFNMFAV